MKPNAKRPEYDYWVFPPEKWFKKRPPSTKRLQRFKWAVKSTLQDLKHKGVSIPFILNCVQNHFFSSNVPDLPAAMKLSGKGPGFWRKEDVKLATSISILENLSQICDYYSAPIITPEKGTLFRFFEPDEAIKTIYHARRIIKNFRYGKGGRHSEWRLNQTLHFLTSHFQAATGGPLYEHSAKILIALTGNSNLTKGHVESRLKTIKNKIKRDEKMNRARIRIAQLTWRMQRKGGRKTLR